MKKPLINHHLASCALILLLALGIYWNSLQGDFIWDDWGLILDNAGYLSDWKNIFTALVKPCFGQTPYYRPFLTVSFIIDYQLWGVNPFGYHYTNVLLHTTNALLVYLFIYILFRQTYLALFTSLLFASHPVQTEAVAWISGRNDVLLTFFALLTLIAYQCWHDFKGIRRIVVYAGYHAAYAAVLLTKESGIVLPLLMVLVDYVSAGSQRIKPRAYGGIVLISILYLSARALILGDTGLNLGDRDYVHAAFTMVAAYAYYCNMLLFPLFQNAVPTITDPGTGNQFVFVSSITFVAFLLALAVVCLKKLRELSCAIIWVFVSLLPVCGIVPLLVPALEHRLYLASIGFSLIIPFSVLKLQQYLTRAGWRTILLCLLLLLVVVYSAKSGARNAIWQNERAFWVNTVNGSPGSALARNNLGIVYAREGEHEKAIEEFKTALSFYDEKSSMTDAYSRSHHANIYNNLGRSYYHLLLNYWSRATHKSASANAKETLLDLDEEAYKLYAFSYACYQSALRVDPSSTETHNNLGDLYSLMKEYRSADKEYTKAMQIDVGSGR